MIKSTITAEFDSDIKTVWDIITDNQNYSWRSDLSNLVIQDEDKFTEYSENGFATEFNITNKEPYKKYEFDLENKNMKGHWIGVFTQSDRGTQIEFTEELQIKNPVMRVIAGLFMPVKKMQETYIKDLKKELNELI